MTVDFDITKHQFKGVQKLRYTNHSPDTLRRVFYHLYFNAFQPGSAMDVRSRTIEDPDERIADRISRLNQDEIGYQRIQSLTQDGKKVHHQIEGTVMEVTLAEPILPGHSAVFNMVFEAQVPVQVRRCGRMNSEGVDYTMTQWYPKMAEYDRDGWHTDPYVSREFHGVFGTFDVKITIDSSYTLAATGVLQNPEEVGHGYAPAGKNAPRLTWHFKAENVHDFAWAADPQYRHLQWEGPNGMRLHFFHLQDSVLNRNWERLVPYTVEFFEIMNERFGEYPYPQFSVIQGGDGGMEYPMCTMIMGEGSLGGLISVTVHEAIHNWFYGVLATNELKYPWMDEGFTSYAQNIVLDQLFRKEAINPHAKNYRNYLALVTNTEEEPLSTHADHYETNAGYGVGAYSKGSIFLHQLSYIIGEDLLNKGMLQYFETWKFKHPTPDDFKRIMENVSDMELDWYFEDWIGTSKQIDYAIRGVHDDKKTTLILERKGSLPMPLEVEVRTEKKTVVYYIPLEIMRGAKPSEYPQEVKWVQAADWPWVYPLYELEIAEKPREIISIVIDPKGKMADVMPVNNVYPNPDEIIFDGSTP